MSPDCLSIAYLGLCETVIDNIEEAMCMHSIAHERRKLSATLRSSGLREVDDR